MTKPLLLAGSLLGCCMGKGQPVGFCVLGFVGGFPSRAVHLAQDRSD